MTRRKNTARGIEAVLFSCLSLMLSICEAPFILGWEGGALIMPLGQSALGADFFRL